MRRHPIPMTTLRGLWPTTAAARNRDAGLLQETAGSPAPDCSARSLALLAHATTAITVMRPLSNRREALESIDLFTTERRHCLTPLVVRKPAAPTPQHVTQHRDRPGLLVVGNASVFHRDSLAKKTRVAK
jgi:hypothetical protein